MYQNILIAIENSDADRTVLEHVQQLAKLTGASLLLVHVADGWVARHYDELELRESEEMKEDRAYLRQRPGAADRAGFARAPTWRWGTRRRSSSASPRRSTST